MNQLLKLNKQLTVRIWIKLNLKMFRSREVEIVSYNSNCTILVNEGKELIEILVSEMAKEFFVD